MRFVPIFLLASFCSAQTIVVSNNSECMAGRILVPRDVFTMPMAKTPEMPTMKGSVISTPPACAKAQPKPTVKRAQPPFTRPVKPKLELLPNPFTPFTK